MSWLFRMEPSVASTSSLSYDDAPGYHRFRVGNYEVTVLSDGISPMPAIKLLKGDRDKIARALRGNAGGELVPTSHNSFLVNVGDSVVLVDAGAGSMLGPHTGKLVANLRAAGFEPEQVNEVYLTHMHTDHIGGLVSSNKRVFPNAVVRANQRDVDYWMSEANKLVAPEVAKRFFDATVAALSPYFAAGKLQPFDDSAELRQGIRARPAYGHTPGHTMYEVSSQGEQILLWGDIVHVADVQFADPTVTIAYDADPDSSAKEHWQMFKEVADQRLLIGGAHLPYPGIGHVREDGKGGYEFIPAV